MASTEMPIDCPHCLEIHNVSPTKMRNILAATLAGETQTVGLSGVRVTDCLLKFTTFDAGFKRGRRVARCSASEPGVIAVA